MKRIVLRGKIAVFALLSFLVPYVLLGQQVEGSVTNENGEALVGATVILKGTKFGARVNLDGTYKISADSGAYTVVAKMMGYIAKERKINLSGGSVKADFVMQERGTTMSEIVVTGTRSRKTQKETPASITVMSEQKIADLQNSSQADALRTVPGIRAEGGGGEVAANIFVRGLPAGGQYQYVSLQLDGLPLESTFGMTSSAADVYFRPDLAIDGLEFLRGGPATLFGIGSVAGIINYTTKTGGRTPETIVKYRTDVSGDGPLNNRQRADFYTGGSFSKESQFYYSISGFYRFDNGPLYTGLNTEGFQLRGTFKKLTETGVYKVTAQYIDDRVQFFLPLPLDGSTKTRLTGNDGERVFSVQTADAANFSYMVPTGLFTTDISEGVKTKGGMIMADINQGLSDDGTWQLNAKFKYARYEHQFGLFLDGDGVANVPETKNEYLSKRGLDTLGTGHTFTYKGTDTEVPDGHTLFANRILDRSRPFFEMSGEANVIKDIVVSDDYKHNISIGTFAARMEVEDFNVITTYLGELNNAPRLVDLSYTNTSGNTVNYTNNGIAAYAVSYTNKKLQSSKLAWYFVNEMVFFDRLRFDLGFRYDWQWGSVQQEQTASNIAVQQTDGRTATIGRWGTGVFDNADVAASDWALSTAISYDLENHAIYGNFSRGFYFNSMRSLPLRSGGIKVDPVLRSEMILQAEVGWKVELASHFLATVSGYYIGASDRTQVDYVNDGQGGVEERVSRSSTRTFGAEATFAWNIFPSVMKGLSLEGNVTYQNHAVSQWEGNEDRVGNQIRRQPTILGNWGLYYNNYGFSIGYIMNINGPAFADDANTNELPAFENSRFDIGYTFMLDRADVDYAAKTLRIRAGINNVWNSEGITEGSPRQGSDQVAGKYFIGRPILPRRFFVELIFTM